jgi:hypothetical protein
MANSEIHDMLDFYVAHIKKQCEPCIKIHYQKKNSRIIYTHAEWSLCDDKGCMVLWQPNFRQIRIVNIYPLYRSWLLLIYCHVLVTVGGYWIDNRIYCTLQSITTESLRTPSVLQLTFHSLTQKLPTPTLLGYQLPPTTNFFFSDSPNSLN